MKTLIYLSGLFFLLLFSNCSSSSSDDDSGINLNKCNERTFEAYQLMYSLAVEYGEDPSASNCNSLKEAAQNVKNIFEECDLWEGESQESKDEINDIINLEC